MRDPYMTEFQFHKGTIKTLHAIDSGSKSIYFNSIKVRLKRLLVTCHYSLSVFQFHKGTIKTVFDFVCIYVYNISIP